MGFQLGNQVLGIPDTVIHPASVVIDQTDFFRRIQLCNRAYTSAHEKSQILVRFADDIRVQERRMLWIVDSGENVRVDVVHRFAFENRLGEAFRIFVTPANSFLPMLKSRGGVRRGLRRSSQSGSKLRVDGATEAKNHFSEIFFGGRAARAANHLLCIQMSDRLKCEMSRTDENGAGDEFIDRAQQSHRSGLELECSDIHIQRIFLDVK